MITKKAHLYSAIFSILCAGASTWALCVSVTMDRHGWIVFNTICMVLNCAFAMGSFSKYLNMRE